ncbi:MAG TPA: cobyric acid synthase, partial [Nitrospirales bacterium]|nr:cobyric acid synthase [Nitrospirales bacterium]
MARTLMIQGTGSHVGKSVLTAALCRIFRRRGVAVAPFKSQNMSNNSYATPDGREIGRAQAVQAMACGLEPRTDFNPVLIKPSSDVSAQLVMNGRVAGTLQARDFGRVRRDCWPAVEAAFARLSVEFDLIVLEGAGSPAEVNLRDADIVNMHMAAHARAPVLLVGDIDRGGVLASIVGTVALLTPEERRHLKGFIVNKFRGDPALLTPGLDIVTARTGLRSLGIVPFWRGARLPEEDAVDWAFTASDRHHCERLTIGVVEVPCVSNATDLEALAGEPDVRLVPVRDGSADTALDALIFPGSKNTPQALTFVREHGIDRLAKEIIARGGMVIGLCAGYQLLGEGLADPEGIESASRELRGLGLLDIDTRFRADKTTRQVSAIHRASGLSVRGYEIHMGETSIGDRMRPVFEVQLPDGGTRPDGASSPDGLVWGTYLHGVFDQPEFRRAILNGLRDKRGWPSLSPSPDTGLEKRLDAWADFVAEHIEIDAI